MEFVRGGPTSGRIGPGLFGSHPDDFVSVSSREIIFAR